MEQNQQVLVPLRLSLEVVVKSRYDKCKKLERRKTKEEEALSHEIRLEQAS